MLRNVLLLAIVGLSGCVSGIQQSGSPNITPMFEQFPFRGSQPLARELRYTYTEIFIMDGKPRAPNYAADPLTLAEKSPQRGPVGVLAQVAGFLERENSGAAYGTQLYTGVSTTRDGVGYSMAAIMPALALHQYALDQVTESTTQKKAHALALWVHDTTGVVGAQAPEGSQLQLDFVSIQSGSRGGLLKGESRIDVVVLGKLTDGRGQTLVSNRGIQLYTHKDPPATPLPRDAIRLPLDFPPAEKVNQKVAVVGWQSMQLTVVASAAVAELYRQVSGK
jgi:hypothetical protein